MVAFTLNAASVILAVAGLISSDVRWIAGSLGALACGNFGLEAAIRSMGWRSPVCMVRRGLDGILALMARSPFASGDVREVVERSREIDRWRTATTAGVLDALGTVISCLYPVEHDQAQTLLALDHLKVELEKLVAGAGPA